MGFRTGPKLLARPKFTRWPVQSSPAHTGDHNGTIKFPEFNRVSVSFISGDVLHFLVYEQFMIVARSLDKHTDQNLWINLLYCSFYLAFVHSFLLNAFLKHKRYWFCFLCVDQHFSILLLVCHYYLVCICHFCHISLLPYLYFSFSRHFPSSIVILDGSL